MSENVIEFPNKPIETVPSSIEESQQHITEVRRLYCDNICEDAIEAVLSVIHSYGLMIKSNETAIKDLVFLEEAVKAFVYRYKNVPHRMHEFIEETVTMTDDAKQELQQINEEATLNN